MTILYAFVLFPHRIHTRFRNHFFSQKKYCLFFYIKFMEIIDYILVNDAQFGAHFNIVNLVTFNRKHFTNIIATNLHAMFYTRFFSRIQFRASFHRFWVKFFFSFRMYHYDSFEPNEFHSNWFNFNTVSVSHYSFSLLLSFFFSKVKNGRKKVVF